MNDAGYVFISTIIVIIGLITGLEGPCPDSPQSKVVHSTPPRPPAPAPRPPKHYDDEWSDS